MKKFILISTVAILAIVRAYAGPGQSPLPEAGFGTVDGNWLLGLSGGQNDSFQAGISAAGTTQATATKLPIGKSLLEIDSVSAAASGVMLPVATAGTRLFVYNNTSNPVWIYPYSSGNPFNGGLQDTLSGATSTVLVSQSTLMFFSAKTGVWAQ